MLMAASSLRGRFSTPRVEPVRQPAADGNFAIRVIRSSPEATVRPSRYKLPVPERALRAPPRLEMFQMRQLRVDEQAGGGGKSRTLGFLGQSRNAK